jgi:hypothetical protein
MVPIREHIPKPTISVATMVDPTGVPISIEIIIPKNAHTTDNIAEKIVTLLNVLNILMDESAGKITSADIRSEPTRFIASTMMTAMITAIRKLYASAFVPTLLANVSSKVTANILL